MHRFEFVRAGDLQHRADWEALRARGLQLAAVHAPDAVLGERHVRAVWCRMLTAGGTLLAGAVIVMARSRKLPLFYLGRVHFSAMPLLELGESGIRNWLDALRRLPGAPSVLSLHLYSVVEAERVALEQQLARMNFMPEMNARTFHRTLLVPVHGTATERRERLSYAARRGIRQITERGYRVHFVRDPSASARVAWLNAQALHRTGGRPRQVDYPAIIRAAQDDPESSVVLGVYHPDRVGESALVGFAHGYVTGSSVVYASAGTERAADIGSTPLSYGLVAHLMDWTAERGYDLFDFGGITPADAIDHPLAGISEFKRKFRGVETQVASDYCVTVRPSSAAVLRLLDTPLRLLSSRRLWG